MSCFQFNFATFFRNKTKELEDYILRLKNQLGEAEVKHQNLDKEFAHYREQQNTKPEVRLQSEINLLTLEKVKSETRKRILVKVVWPRIFCAMYVVGDKGFNDKNIIWISYLLIFKLNASKIVVLYSEMKMYRTLKSLPSPVSNLC